MGAPANCEILAACGAEHTFSSDFREEPEKYDVEDVTDIIFSLIIDNRLIIDN